MTSDERSAFLEGRRGGIGSSDVAAIIGCSKWSNALQVYLDKIEPVPSSGARMAAPLEWGIRSEPIIAAAISDYHGWTLRKMPTMRHAEHDFLLASIDRMNEGDEICEIKTSARGEGYGEPETDDVPQSVWLQVQHQLAVVHSHMPHVEVGWVFALISQCDFRRYYIRRDPEYLDSVLPALKDFWECVATRTPPEVDWEHQATMNALNRLYKPKPGTYVAMDDTAAMLVDECKQQGELAKAAKDAQEQCKMGLVAKLGEFAVGVLPDGRIVERKMVTRKAYEVNEVTYPQLYFKKAMGFK